MRWYVSAPGTRDARYGETESVAPRVPHRVASLSAGVGSAAALFYAAFDARYDLVSCAGRTVAVANGQLKRGLQAASVLIRADVDTGSPRGRCRHIEAVAHAASNPGTVLLVSGRKHCGNALVDSMLAQACPWKSGQGAVASTEPTVFVCRHEPSHCDYHCPCWMKAQPLLHQRGSCCNVPSPRRAFGEGFLRSSH